MSRTFLLRRKRMHRPFRVGMLIRQYQGAQDNRVPYLNHNLAQAGTYFTGTVQSIDPPVLPWGKSQVRCCWYVVETLVINGLEVPESHRVGALSCFNTDDNSVFVLEAPPQLSLPLKTAKPWWEK